MSLAEIYDHPAVRAFGSALRAALREPDIQDYASLIDLENVEREEDFAEAVRKFLRRNHRRLDWLPDDEKLVQLMRLVDEKGVPQVRAALVSHALVFYPRKEEGKEG
jgi:hypothetical protein